MRFALIDQKREEAKPDLIGNCPGCYSTMVAKCGEKKVWHWAHRGKKMCDSWWENETEWHRNWKSNFPEQWQERVQFAADGEKHIADVKTDKDWVLEFQHSFLNPGERRARSAFYQNLVWIVNGNRRARYKTQFFKTLNDMPSISEAHNVRPVFLSFSSLLEEWTETKKPVIFDFGEESEMWCLIPSKSTGMYAHVAAISREVFVKFHLDPSTDFFGYIEHLKALVFNYENRIVQPAQVYVRSNVINYSRRLDRARSRMRL